MIAADLCVAILAGGRGTRLGERTARQPKALVEVGGRPVLWHIMKHFSHHGWRRFVVASGYRGDDLRRHFAAGQGAGPEADPGWSVTLVDTGLATMTGGRIKRLAPHLGGGTFLLTWCDGVSDVDLKALLAYHRAHGKLATLTAVRPPPRFGHLDLVGGRVQGFDEKPPAREGWINGAFFVLEPGVFDYIEGDGTQWEREPLQRLVAEGQLMAYRHEGFWRCMDTVHDAEQLDGLWRSGAAPWKTWKDADADSRHWTSRLHRHGPGAVAGGRRT